MNYLIRHFQNTRLRAGEVSALRRIIINVFLCAASSVSDAKAETLPSGSLILTHTSRYYHTDPETIAATNALQAEALFSGAAIFALGQSAVATDPDWYVTLDERVQTMLSHAGEHKLQPISAPGAMMTVTAAGGYLSACLGRTVSEITARFIVDTDGLNLDVRLRTAAIYTGYLRNADGQLIPSHPRHEAALDDSIDGLNLWQVTAPMDDSQWTEFMRETLDIAIFEKLPMRQIASNSLASVEFRLMRGDKILAWFVRQPIHHHGRSPERRRIVTFTFD